LIIIATFAEILSIGSVIPFLTALTNPDKILSNHLIQLIVNLLGFQSSGQAIIFLIIVFSFFAFLSGSIRLFLLMFSNRVSFAAGADLSIAIYEKTLYQPYMVHISRNTSEIINAILNKTNLIIYNVILPILTMMSNIIMLLAIVFVLIYVDPLVCLVTLVLFGSIYIIIARQTKNKKIKNSYVIASQSNKILKFLQEGLGGIRDVLIDGSQHMYLKKYRQSDLILRNAQASNQFASQAPRYIMESFGMILIALLAFYLFSREGGQKSALPSLGIMALGAQRLLPLMQQAYTAWSSIQGSFHSLQDTLDLLDQNLPSDSVIGEESVVNFFKNIELKSVGFTYSTASSHVFSNLNLTIKKGDRIGLIGVTGSGKSTFVDILMGLLEPTSGVMTVDDNLINHKNVRAWQKHIAHVPQTIFIADTSIAENIAFGVESKDIDWDRVRLSAENAQLKDVVANLPDGFNTILGERGIRLSGGQRQRIGIARAFYKNVDIFVFDEATSALDNQTEDLLMKAIDSLGSNITIIMIAHRLTTLKKCTKIIEFSEGKIVELDSYENMMNPPT
jgi:ATP-binding cassette subfamily B protein